MQRSGCERVNVLGFPPVLYPFKKDVAGSCDVLKGDAVATAEVNNYLTQLISAIRLRDPPGLGKQRWLARMSLRLTLGSVS